MKKIGILGAGQLGCMLAESIFQLGGEVSFYDPNPCSPGFKRTPNFTCADWDNLNALKNFFSACDVVTYEFENVKTDLLNELITLTKTSLYPSPHVLQITQNRFLEKDFLTKNDFPVVKFEHFSTFEDFSQKIINWTFPFVVKTIFGGYDGKGQWKILNSSDLEKCFEDIHKNTTFIPLIAEEFMQLNYETSVIVARNKNEEICAFPVFKNIHKNHILHTTYLPAKIPNYVCEKLITIAKQAAEKLNVVGILTTEFFIDTNENIFVNEFAPRPHNSGHISRKACNVSQFDLHARILLDLPLIEPYVLSEDTYLMRNIMGENYLSDSTESYKNLIFLKEFQTELEGHSQNMLEFYLYGKDSPRPKRKMGHFIAKLNKHEEQQL